MLPDFLTRLMNDDSSDNLQVKCVFRNGDYYYKFYKNEIYKNQGLDNLNILEERVRIINSITDDNIQDYKIFDNGIIYFQCKTVKSIVQAFEPKHRAMFKSEEDFKLDWIKNVTGLLEKMYPLYFADWSKHNVYIQPDLSWMLIDTEEILNHCRKPWDDVCNRLEYSFLKICDNDKEFYNKHIDSYLEGLRLLYKDDQMNIKTGEYYNEN